MFCGEDGQENQQESSGGEGTSQALLLVPFSLRRAASWALSGNVHRDPIPQPCISPALRPWGPHAKAESQKKNYEMLLAYSNPGGDLEAGRQMQPHLLLKTKQDQVGLAVSIC